MVSIQSPFEMTTNRLEWGVSVYINFHACNKRHSREVFHKNASLQAVYDFAFGTSQRQVYMLSAGYSNHVQWLHHGVI